MAHLEFSKFSEYVEYAKAVRSRMSKTDLAVDLGLALYIDDDLQDLNEYQIKEIVKNIMNEL